MAVERHGAVGLGDGGGSQRRLVKGAEERVEGFAKGSFDLGANAIEGLGRHVVLQAGELLDVFARQQVDAGREDLAEFDEGRAQLVQEAPEALWGAALRDFGVFLNRLLAAEDLRKRLAVELVAKAVPQGEARDLADALHLLNGLEHRLRGEAA